MADRSYGTREQRNGYVTTMESIAGKNSRDLERSLGYAASSLATGFYVYALLDVVGIADFEWKDQTVYSGGWHWDPTISEYVQRGDELRAQLGKLNQYDEAKTDQAIRLVMLRQVERLNVRVGPKRIVKVFPKQEVLKYPPANFYSIPQLCLLHRKSFVRLAEVMAGESAPRV